CATQNQMQRGMSALCQQRTFALQKQVSAKGQKRLSRGFLPRNLAAPRRLDCGDVDLSHAHHGFKRALCFVAASCHRFGQYPRRDLPRQAPLVFAPAARAFLAAILDDGVPIAIRLSLIVSGDLERKCLIMFEHGAAVETNAVDASNFELDRQHIPLLAGRIVTGCTVDGTQRAVGKSLGIKSSSGLGVLIVPETNCVLCHCISFDYEHSCAACSDTPHLLLLGFAESAVTVRATKERTV